MECGGEEGSSADGDEVKRQLTDAQASKYAKDEAKRAKATAEADNDSDDGPPDGGPPGGGLRLVVVRAVVAGRAVEGLRANDAAADGRAS